MKLGVEQIQGIAALREKLNERVIRLHEELEETNLTIAALDAALKQSSFTRASNYTPDDAPMEHETADAGAQTDHEPEHAADAGAQTDQESDRADPKIITTAKGDEVIGLMYTYPDRIVIIPDQDVTLHTRTSPFKTFFLDRILGEMQKKDSAEVDAGRLDADAATSYEVEAPQERIIKITITNYRTEDRAREIDSTIRWVLNRMLENVNG